MVINYCTVVIISYVCGRDQRCGAVFTVRLADSKSYRVTVSVKITGISRVCSVISRETLYAGTA